MAPYSLHPEYKRYEFILGQTMLSLIKFIEMENNIYIIM